MRMLGERYRLEQRIGVGGMSEVWCAHDLVLDRPVAIKLLTPGQEGHLGHEAAVERIRTEARSAARLVHPNVASVHDFGTSSFLPGQQVPYLVMELVEGETLAAHLRAGALDWQIGVRVCAEISAALASAHAHGIVHRDIKPANVMLTPAGVKVLDFGIAASVDKPESTPDGLLLGTPAYLAPELFEQEPPTPAADMYALGVLLFFCLTGRPPYPADRPEHLLAVKRRRRPEPLPVIDGLPEEIADLCRRCLARDPDERPTSQAAALVLAEAVDARVYVPLGGPMLPRQRPSPVSPWTERAAAEVTEAAVLPLEPTGAVDRGVTDRGGAPDRGARDGDCVRR